MQRSPSRASRDADRDWWWILDPRQSLRARATLLVGLATLTFTALLTWITGALYRRTLESQLRAHFESLAYQLGDKLDRTIYERYRTLQLGAALTSLRDPATPRAERRRTLDALRESSPDLAWLGLTDRSGKILVATTGLFESDSAATRPWFRGAREQPYAGALREIPELSRATPDTAAPDAATRFFDLAVPVADPHGEFGGILAAHVRWSWARDIQLSVIPDTTAREQLGATVYSDQDVLLDSGASGWSAPPDAPALPENRRGRGSFIEPTALGTTYLTGFARSRGFREFRGLGWLTVVRQPVTRAFAPVASLRRGIAVWGCAFTLAAMLAAWLLTARHAKRLRIVRAAAERIHEGDILAVLPHPPGNSELARMCHALGELVEDLRARPAPASNPAAENKPGP